MIDPSTQLHDMSCTECVYGSYPSSYNSTRQTVALCMFVYAAIVVVGGLCLFWSRRHSRLLSKRDDWSTALAALCVVLSCDTAYREYFSEAAMPCALKVINDYLQGALIPSVLVCRCVGLYARHLRQQVLLQNSFPNTTSVVSSSSDVASPPAMPWPAGPPAPDQIAGRPQDQPLRRSARSWHLTLDLVLLRLRLDTRAQLQRVVGLWLIPWVVFYFIRLGISPEYRSGAVGCRLDDADAAVSVLGGVLAAAVIFVILLRLWTRPDALFLRSEISIQLVAWLVLLVWFVYGFISPTFDIAVVNSAYSILLGNTASLISSVWLPAILSFSDECFSAPPTLIAQLDRYFPVNTSHTSDMAAPRANSQLPTGADTSVTATLPVVVGTRDNCSAQAGNEKRDHITASVVSLLTRAHDHETFYRLTEPVPSSLDPPFSTGHPRMSLPLNRMQTETTTVLPITAIDSLAVPGTVLAALAALPHLFEPAPTERELDAILQQPAQRTIGDARALRLFTGLLLVCESGRRILHEALVKEFNAELLGFMLACADVRLASCDVIPPAALQCTLARGRSRRLALPSVRHVRAAPGSTGASTALESQPECESTHETSEHVGADDTSASITAVHSSVSFLRSQFVTEGAPYQVNISAAQVRN